MIARVCAAALLSGAFAASAQDARSVDPAQGLTLSNRFVRFTFEPQGMGLQSMVDLTSGKEHIPPGSARRLLWQLKLGRGTTSKIAGNNYKPCSYARVEPLLGGGARAVMEWNDLRWWKEDRALTVRVTISLPADSGIAEWRISVDNRSDYWGLQNVVFPAVKAFPASGAYDLARPVFASGGHLLRKLTAPAGARHPSGFWPMQFCSLHQGADSVYFGTRDGEGRAKNFLIEPGKMLSMIHHPENLNEAGSDWQDYYSVEFGVFQGTWVKSAKHYRQWALQQKWAAAGPLSKRRVPALVKDAAFWLRDRWLPNTMPDGTRVEQEPAPIDLNRQLIAALDRIGTPSALHWYNWHQTPYDNNYPRFLPAKEGFADRVTQLVSRGVLVMPYTNGCSADMNLPDWEKFAPYANIDESGGYRLHFYSETAGRLLTMCPSQSFWQGTIERLAGDLVSELGVNALYVDQVSAMEHELCFNPAHGHPRGGGRYWADGNREVMRRVRNAVSQSGRDVAITSEGADEMFFDLVDSNLTWAPPSADEIPLMQAVYSGYTLLFGSPCDYRQSENFFRYAQGQALIDGRQPGWMDASLFSGKFESKVNYLRDCARTRQAHGKHLTYGQLLGPVAPLGAVPVIAEKVFGWYRNEAGAVPGAEARLWQAEDGARAVFFANYTDQAVPFRYRLDGVERTELLPPASVKVRELKP